MAISTAFRATPILGPGIMSHDAHYWFLPQGVDVSYPLGTRVTGSDGMDYVMVQAGAALDADDVVTISVDWEATADAGGSWAVPTDVTDGTVPDGAYFHAVRVSEGYEDKT